MSETLNLNTRFRDSGTNADATWILTYPKEYERSVVNLEHVSFPNHIYPLGWRNRIYFLELGAPTVLIAHLDTEIAYHGTLLATIISATMTAASASSGLGLTYACVYDSNTNKLRLACDAGQSYRIVTGIRSAEYFIGYETDQDTYYNTHTFEYPIDLTYPRLLHVCCDFISSSSFSTATRNNILATIDLGASFGYVVAYSPAYRKPKMMIPYVEQIRLSLRDEEGRVVGLSPNTFVDYTLEITYHE